MFVKQLLQSRITDIFKMSTIILYNNESKIELHFGKGMKGGNFKINNLNIKCKINVFYNIDLGNERKKNTIFLVNV